MLNSLPRFLHSVARLFSDTAVCDCPGFNAIRQIASAHLYCIQMGPGDLWEAIRTGNLHKAVSPRNLVKYKIAVQTGDGEVQEKCRYSNFIL